MFRNTALEELINVSTFKPSFCWTDWDREKLLEDWMSNAEDCCQRSGVQMPTPPPSGYNAWDTLPSPRTPRTTRSSVTSPDEISLSPTDGLALVRLIAMHDVMIHVLYHSMYKYWKEYWHSLFNVSYAHVVWDLHVQHFCFWGPCGYVVWARVLQGMLGRVRNEI